MPILNSIASWFMKKRMHQIELFMKYPGDVQDEWLRKLLKNAKDTEFGKKYKFSSIETYEQFKKQVPLQDYETLKPSIDRIRRGEQNILWPSEIKWFAKSSGTTDKSKFLPVTKESLDGCHYNGGRDTITLHCINNPETKFFTGKSLTLGGSRQSNFFGNHDRIAFQTTKRSLIGCKTRNVQLFFCGKKCRCCILVNSKVQGA